MVLEAMTVEPIMKGVRIHREEKRSRNWILSVKIRNMKRIKQRNLERSSK